jgi:Tol biopolymer transport system component
LSPDGKQIAISNYVGDKRTSTIFILPLTGSDDPIKITSEDSGHSFLHSWSPDGKKLLFTGFRTSNMISGQ